MSTMLIPNERRYHSKFRAWRIIQKYMAVFQISVANSITYISEVIFRSLLLVVLVFILSQLWQTTFSGQGTTILGGFSIDDLIWYLIAAEAIAMSLPTLTRKIDQEVRNGQLSYSLTKPCNYIVYNFANYMGERVIRFIINCFVGAILAIVMVGLPNFTWQGLLAWPLVTCLAFAIDFVCYFTIGLLAFWSEETQPFAFIFSRLTLVLGGVLAPLEIFPEPFRSIALALPFSTILYGPARTLVHYESDFVWSLLLQQGLTLLAVSTLLFALYHVAVRRVNINGG